ncbi:polysaccharide deacetylase family protein [Pseudonocardia sp. T1-2H]|uniref:polysaccharide deacetylase family protein n=1 Tax=Pseudonocardia sp. T1-2H TaxID=3128899 RepID=UPI0031010529
MSLVVETPPGRAAERGYVLGVVLGDRLGLDWRLEQSGRADVRLRFDADPAGPAVTMPDTLLGIPEEEWLTPASLRADPPATLPVDDPGSTSLTAGQRVPLLLGPAAADGPLVTFGPRGARLSLDVFGTAFFMLTRYEEAVLPDRDTWNRFPAAASAVDRAGMLRTPVVDVAVELLWSALERVWPRLRRRTGPGYRVLLTHDVDDPLSTLGRGPLDVAHQFAADLVLRRDPGLAARRARALLRMRSDHTGDPHDTFDLLMDVSERHSLASAFYLQSHERADPGGGAPYALTHPRIVDLMRRVHVRGHELGYHAGFGTYRDAGRTAAEFARLRGAARTLGIDQERWGGRQHYLQWDPTATWRNWADAGLDHDCTVAYADAVGFRTGTSHEFPVFDLAAGRPLPLRERPFQVMDVTLSGYLGLTPDAAADEVLAIAAECRRYGGTLGLLWHNDTLRGSRTKRWYAALVAAVSAG